MACVISLSPVLVLMYYPALYAEMREGLLADQSDFATKLLREHLKCRRILTVYRNYSHVITAGAQKADQVFLPVLENSLKAQKLRTTLNVFERSKFFFNLPSSLAECIRAVCLLIVASLSRYDKTCRDGMTPRYEITRKGSSCSNHDLDN